VTVIQLTFDTPCQPHPDVVETDSDALPPVAATVRLVGLMVYEHEAAGCVTVNVRPAIVRVPLRCAVPVFAAAVKRTVPPPVPDWPDVTVIHELLL
jgi:hypothetical protein